MGRILKLQPLNRTGKLPRSPRAVAKLIRVAASGGKLVIISKQ